MTSKAVVGTTRPESTAEDATTPLVSTIISSLNSSEVAQIRAALHISGPPRTQQSFLYILRETTCYLGCDPLKIVNGNGSVHFKSDCLAKPRNPPVECPHHDRAYGPPAVRLSERYQSATNYRSESSSRSAAYGVRAVPHDNAFVADDRQFVRYGRCDRIPNRRFDKPGNRC